VIKTVLITGAGGGLGGHTADLFGRNGWRVFAADIAPIADAPGRYPIQLDVTSMDSCTQAAAVIAQECDGLDAVINFAGVLDMGCLVEIPEEQMRRIIDINLLGTYRVNKAMFDLVRQGHGRIVNISSEAGRQPSGPIGGPYSISKHAVEAYSDSLRRELMFVGIPVIIIQPGSFKTDMTTAIADRFDKARHPGSPFATLVDQVAKAAVKEDAKARDPHILAEAVWDAVNASKPKARYAVGHNARTGLVTMMPAAVLDRILKSALS
jgi:NAD(P)-dependent dehydrogenase (short-subunit alcohol dehydrogenase family)